MWIVAWNTKRYSCHRLKADGCREEIFCSFWLVLTQVCCNFLHYSIVGSKLETPQMRKHKQNQFLPWIQAMSACQVWKSNNKLKSAWSSCLCLFTTPRHKLKNKARHLLFLEKQKLGGEGALRSPLLKYLKWIVLSQKVRRRRRCSPVKQLFDLCCFLVGIVPVELFVSWNYSNLVLEIAVGFQKEVQDADLDSLTTMPVDFRWLISKVTCGMFSTRVTAGGVPMTYWSGLYADTSAWKYGLGGWSQCLTVLCQVLLGLCPVLLEEVCWELNMVWLQLLVQCMWAVDVVPFFLLVSFALSFPLSITVAATNK